MREHIATRLIPMIIAECSYPSRCPVDTPWAEYIHEQIVHAFVDDTNKAYTSSTQLHDILSIPTLVIVNKCDLVDDRRRQEIPERVTIHNVPLDVRWVGLVRIVRTIYGTARRCHVWSTSASTL
jgi:hypothetical protein